jgi:hypothetical protein
MSQSSVTNRAYFVGSGFSRSIHESMPTLHELSDQVRSGMARLDPDLNDIVVRLENNFEQWVSFLAEDRPWLRRPENLRHPGIIPRGKQSNRCDPQG